MLSIAECFTGDSHNDYTAAGASILPSNGLGKAKRKHYVRAFKLTVVNHYHENNLYQTFSR